MQDERSAAPFREILRQGERQLADQKEQVESVLRRAGELVRLGIAVVGGLIVIGGILATRGAHVDSVGVMGMAAGLVLVVACIGGLASLLAGVGRLGRVANGPDMRTLVGKATSASDLEIVGSLAATIPKWIDQNHRTMEQMRFVMGSSLLLLAVGVVMLIGTFVYILGRGIHA